MFRLLANLSPQEKRRCNIAYPRTVELANHQVYVNESTSIFPIGQKGETPDGRIFRFAWASSAAAINASLLCQATAEDSTWDTIVIATTTKATDNKITVTNQSDTFAENELKGGFITCETDPGNTGPNIWPIEEHVQVGGGTQNYDIYLADGISVGQILTAGTDTLYLRPNLYSKIIVYPTTPTGIPIGITMVQITASYYSWIQTRGVGACCIDNNGTDYTIGENLVADATSAGRVESESQTAQLAIIGTTLGVQGQTDGDVMPIFITIE